MSTLFEPTRPGRSAGLNPFDTGPEALYSRERNVTEQDGCGRTVRRMFSLKTVEELGCVDWYQYPHVAGSESSERAGRR